MTRTLARLIKRLLIGATLACGVAVGLSLLLLPHLSGLVRPHIIQSAETALGRDLEIGELTTQWQGQGPQLALRKVRLSSAGRASKIVLDQVQIDIAPIDTILHLRPVIKRVALVGASLSFQQMENGEFRLTGLGDQLFSGQDDQGASLDQLPLGMGLIDSTIILHGRGSSEPLRLDDVNLRLLRTEGGLTAQGIFRLSDQSDEIRLGAEISGPLNQPEAWSGMLYIETRKLGLERLMALYPGRIPLQTKGALGLRLWGQLDAGRFNRIEGLLDLRAFNLSRMIRGQHRSYGLDSLQTGFRWQRQNGHWLLQLADLNIQRNDIRWPSGAISVKGDKSGEFDAAFSFLRLEDILSLVMLLPENRADPILTGLQKIQPSGDLRDLRFHRRPGSWSAQGIAEHIRSLSWNAIPSINSLSARFSANQSGGVAIVDKPDIRIEFENKLFANPLRLKRLQGKIAWLRHELGWQIASENIQMLTPDFASGSRFNLSIPDQGPVHLSFQNRLENGDVAYVQDYLPTGVMNPRIVEWIKRSLVAGRIEHATTVFSGHLDDFPFDKTDNGYFMSILEVDDVVLDYLSGWPRLERANAELRFIENSFGVTLKKADISASRVTGASARIETLFPVSSLEIKGVVEGPLSDELRVLRDTPLATKLGEVASGVSARGDARLHIHLKEPLSKYSEESRSVSGRVEFLDSRLEMAKWNLQLEQLRGSLAFDHEGIAAEDLKAIALGSEINLNIKTLGGDNKLTEVRSSGIFDIQSVSSRRLGAELPFAKGNALWRLQLKIPHSDQGPDRQVLLKLDSDLKGIEIKLPPPLGKNAKEKKAFQLELNPTAEDRPLPVHIAYTDQVDAQLVLSPGIGADERRFDRVGVQLGGQPAKRPELPGVWIKGRLANFQLAPWLEAQPKTQSNAPPLLPYLGLEIDRFDLFGFKLDQAKIKGSPQPQSWQATIDSQQLKGLVSVPADLETGVVKLDLERLALTTPSDREMKPREKQASKPDPRTLPSIDLASDKLLLNGQDLGEFRLQARSGAKGLDFNKIQVKSSWLDFNLKGNWRQERDQPPRCNANFSLKTDDLGRLQKAINGSAGIQKSSAKASGDIAWKGSPMDFTNFLLDGTLNLKLDKGLISELEPGAARVFGLLNLGALQRRLSLDFTDIFNKGFAFDRIKGSFVVKQGLADTNNLTIDAPTGVINIYGRTNLVDKELDQMVEVIPDITGTLATAGTLVGGPALGAALFVANKVVGKELNKISRIRYLLRGPWDNPQIFREGKKVDASKKKQPSHTLDILDH